MPDGPPLDRPSRDPLLDRVAAIRGCDLVVLMDLQARTVLDSRSSLRVPQGRLDALGAWAAAMLDGGASLALAAGDTALRLALRTGDSGPEALCVVLHPAADIGAVCALVRRGPVR
ncbi:MAG: hypothetical protein MUF73_19985 [Rhodobacteraceae bacterium]|jgi:alkylhydroperoxidase family enzyme|nr:hypothetical protein [Paracoccaceae bacterium]